MDRLPPYNSLQDTYSAVHSHTAWTLKRLSPSTATHENFGVADFANIGKPSGSKSLPRVPAFSGNNCRHYRGKPRTLQNHCGFHQDGSCGDRMIGGRQRWVYK